MKIGLAGPIGVSDIAHLLDPMPASSRYESRGATLLATLIEELLARGQRVVAFTTDVSLAPHVDNIHQLSGHCLDVYVVPQRRTAFRTYRGHFGRMADLFRLERRALEEAIRRGKPTFVHAHWSYEYAWAAQSSGLPYLVTCHDSPRAILTHSRDLYRLGRLLMAVKVLRKARHVTAVSPYLANELKSMTRALIDVVPNPVPICAIDRGRLRHHPRSNGRTVRVAMVINGWSNRKNAATAMVALATLKESYPDLEIALVGPGFGTVGEAMTWADRRGIASAFKFFGAMSYSDVLELLDTTDILVHPALEESFGMTIAEAMSLGIPVVAGEASGAVPWVVGLSEAALLVDVRSERAIRDAVARLIDDPLLYGRVSQNARSRALAEFSPSSIADRYLKHYAALVAESEASHSQDNRVQHPDAQ